MKNKCISFVLYVISFYLMIFAIIGGICIGSLPALLFCLYSPWWLFALPLAAFLGMGFMKLIIDKLVIPIDKVKIKYESESD